MHKLIVCLPIILIFLLQIHRNVANKKPSPSSKNNLIFSAFTVDPLKKQYTYIFNPETDQLSEERAKMVIYIYEENGSVQSNDVLEYGEFLKIDSAKRTFEKILKTEHEEKEKLEEMGEEGKKGPIKRENHFEKKAKNITAQFKLKKDQLDGKVFSFLKLYWDFLEMNAEKQLEKEQKAQKTEKKGKKKEIVKKEMKFHHFVIACKFFMMELFSEGGEGSWLDLFSFMKAEKYEQKWVMNKIERDGKMQKENKKRMKAKLAKTPMNKILERIHGVSLLQSGKLDFLATKAIYKMHEANQKKGKKAEDDGDGDGEEEEEEMLTIQKLLRDDEKVKKGVENVEMAAEKLSTGKPSFRRVIIEGAGPLGLYTAFQLFLAGNNVILVNDRAETYLRNRMVFLDAKYMAQLRLLLGTKYNDLFIGDSSPGQINEGVCGQLNMKQYETALKERLTALASFVEAEEGGGNKEKENTKPFSLQLLYETSLEEVQYPTAASPVYKAMLGPSSKTSIEQAEFYKNLANKHSKEWVIEKILKEIRGTGNEQANEGADPAKIKYVRSNGQIEMISAEKQAEFQFAGKALPLKHYEPAEFDLLVCAGGGNDRIRNEYLGKPVQMTIPKNYGTVVFMKSRIGEFIFKMKTVFYEEDLDDMVEIMKNLEFEEKIKNSEVLSKEGGLKEKYGNISEQIAKGLVIKKKYGATYGNARGYDEYELDGKNGHHFVLGKKADKFVIRLFENKGTLHIASITPPPIEEFFREIEEEKKQYAAEKPDENKIEKGEIDEGKKRDAADKFEAYTQFRTRMERLWSAAVYEFCKLKLIQKEEKEKKARGDLIDANVEINMDLNGNPVLKEKDGNKQVLNFDEYGMVNSATWSLIIWSVKDAVKELGENKNDDGGMNVPNVPSALIAAIGDANTSAHFMTASGLSTGRIGGERLARILREYHEGKIANKEKLLEELKQNLNSIGRRVLKKATLYVEPIGAMEGKKQAIVNTEMVSSVAQAG